MVFFRTIWNSSSLKHLFNTSSNPSPTFSSGGCNPAIRNPSMNKALRFSILLGTFALLWRIVRACSILLFRRQKSKKKIRVNRTPHGFSCHEGGFHLHGLLYVAWRPHVGSTAKFWMMWEAINPLKYNYHPECCFGSLLFLLSFD